MGKPVRLLRALVSPGDNGLFSRAMSAGFWASALRVIVRVLMFARTLVLARLLAPEDFGLMGIATISILFVERMTNGGVEAALVQKKGDVGGYLNTAWTMQIIRSLSTAVVLGLAAPWIADFFGAVEAEGIIRVLAVAVALRGFTNIGVVGFVKDLRFDKQFTLDVANRGAEFMVSIVLAVVWQNVWALVAGVLAGVLARVLTSFVIAEYRPRLQWIWTHVKELFNFGKWIIVTNLTSFAVSNLDDILVGRFLGVTQLGFYRMAFNLSQGVAAEIMVVTSQVAFPAYSTLQESLDRLRSAYVGTLHFVAFLGVPLAFGTILVAPDMVPAILGERWIPIVLALQWLSVAGLARGLGGTISPLYVSQGRPSVPPMFGAAQLLLMVPALPIAIDRYGIAGAAAVVAITGAVISSIALFFGLRYLSADRIDVLQSIGYPAFNGLVMALCVLGAQAVSADTSELARLLLAVTVGGASYIGSVILTSRILTYQAPADLLDRVRGSIAS